MACPEALLDQEARLLDILAQVDAYRIGDSGTLVLAAAGRDAITARR